MFASGIGGGGFAVVRLADGESKSFNFREMAPKAAHRDMYNGDDPPNQIYIAIPRLLIYNIPLVSILTSLL